MTREDIDRIASEYFDDKESEHEMDEVFYLAKKALNEFADNLEQIEKKYEESKTDRCKDCKWRKDSDEVFQRGVSMESLCASCYVRDKE